MHYTITGIRYQLSPLLSHEENTLAAERFLAGLRKGQPLILAAEPDNPFDTNAIAAYIDYERIGYIAKEETGEIHPLLDDNGQRDAVVERTDGHVTLFVSIPVSPQNSQPLAARPRILPASPLGDTVRMPFAKDESRLKLIASRLAAMEVTPGNLQEAMRMAELYIPLMKLSVCHEDTLWRNRISKVLHLACSQCGKWGIAKKAEARLHELYETVNEAVGDMRSGTEHWTEKVFVDHLARLRGDEGLNGHLYAKYRDTFLDGNDFDVADSRALEREYERLRSWLQAMKWSGLRDPSDLKAMGLAVNYLGLSRQELYDLYAVLLIMEKLEGADAEHDGKSRGRVADDTLKRRKAILAELFALVDKGDWAKGVKPSDIKIMLKTVLGMGRTRLCGEDAEMCEVLWKMLEAGRGDERVRVTWQNMVGFMDDRNLLKKKSAPALNYDFFGTKEGYDNINKGRPDSAGREKNMPRRFNEVLPLLEKYKVIV